MLGPLCLKAKEISEEEAEQQLSERWNTEPGEWVRDLQPEEQQIEEELNSLAAMLGNCQIISEEVEVWLQIDEAIKSADPEGISLDDAIDAVLGGLTSLELATAGEGSDDEMGYEQGGREEDGSDGEGFAGFGDHLFYGCLGSIPGAATRGLGRHGITKASGVTHILLPAPWSATSTSGRSGRWLNCWRPDSVG